jgi:hypothetical protein
MHYVKMVLKMRYISFSTAKFTQSYVKIVSNQLMG